MLSFAEAHARLPLAAILRGLKPEEAADFGEILVEEGFTIVEVPLNSPRPFESILRLSMKLAPHALIGAGTVLNTHEIEELRRAGGRLVVSPNYDHEVVARTKEYHLASLPGVATPSEAFAALKAGADALKLFPAEMIPPRVVTAIRAVLPRKTILYAVGGIHPDTMTEYVRAGCNGFGLGSALFRPGITADQLRANARAFVSAWKAIPPAG